MPHVRDLRGCNPEFLEKCRRCALVNLCLWCPAHAALETGAMDDWVEYFCQVAHARAAALGATTQRIDRTTNALTAETEPTQNARATLQG